MLSSRTFFFLLPWLLPELPGQTVAFAQAPGPTAQKSDARTESASAGPSPETLTTARAFFEKGQGYYSVGNYGAAWVEFTSAYHMVELPDLLFNIARCEAKLGRRAEAAKHFRQFLQAKPNDPEAENIRRQIDALEGKAASPVETRSMVPWAATVTGGVGLLLTIGGAGTLGAANADFYALQTTCGTSCERTATEPGRTKSAVGYSLMAVGFAAMFSAAVALPFELRKKDRARPAAAALSLQLSPGGVSVLGRY